MADYKGWKIPENIIIVAKAARIWKDYKRVHEDCLQGYVVDAENKEMLESAHNWAKWTEYVQPYNIETRTYADVIEHQGVEYHFTNEGFTLELLDSASGSSQGGKLSFWNCKITKDDKEFIIGIASDYLLELLLNSTFINGKCQEKLSFARCKGGVGMTTKNMPIYKQFLEDEQKRATMKRGKTKKREIGHLYSTLTGGDVFLGRFYRWYEPVYSETTRNRYWWDRKLIGFERLEKPVEQYWSPMHYEEKTKTSDYFGKYFYWSDSTPARTDCGQVVEIDMTPEEILEKHLDLLLKNDIQTYQLSSIWSSIGVGTSDKEYTMPDYIRKLITDRGCFVKD